MSGIADYYDRKRRDSERYQLQVDAIDQQIREVQQHPRHYCAGQLERLQTNRALVACKLERARYVGD